MLDLYIVLSLVAGLIVMLWLLGEDIRCYPNSYDKMGPNYKNPLAWGIIFAIGCPFINVIFVILIIIIRLRN